MKAVSIILRILAILGAIAAVAGVLMVQNKVANITKEKEAAEQTVQSLRQEVGNHEDILSGLRSQLTARDSDLASARSEITRVRSQLVTAQRDASNSERELREARTRITDLDSQVRSMRQELVDANVQVAQGDPQRLREQEDKIAELQQEVDSLKDQLAVAMRTATTQPAVAGTPTSDIGTAATTAAAPTLASVERGTKTSVIRVDHKNGLIILGLGTESGIQANSEFEIVKGFERPIRLHVQSTQPNFLIANILPGDGNPRAFSAGDEVQLVAR